MICYFLCNRSRDVGLSCRYHGGNESLSLDRPPCLPLTARRDVSKENLKEDPCVDGIDIFTLTDGNPIKPTQLALFHKKGPTRP